MRINILLLLFAFSFAVFGMGCTAKETNETKLDVTEGVGIVGNLKMEELNPGLDGYVSLIVRNNLGGEIAHDVVVTLDNLLPFKVFECGDYHNATENRKDNCPGEFELDKNLPFASHGIEKLFPGQEVEVYWRIKAPSQDEISRIALKHPLYYDLKYTYQTSFYQNIVFMSRTELMKREQAGEEVKVEGESGMSAGEIRVSGMTDQPIVYQFAHPEDMSAKESKFPFALKYKIENLGKGYPLSDMILIFEYPENAIDKEPTASDYGWAEIQASAEDCVIDEKGNTKSCTNWVKDLMGEKEFKKINKSNVLIKRIKREDFINNIVVFIPLKLTGIEMTNLKRSNIPMKIYTFKMYIVYRYFTEGKDYIYVYPIRAY